MLRENSVRPEDILADGVDSTVINGITVRKGTIAAFLANIELLEKKNSTEVQKQEAINMIKALAQTVVSTGLHKHVTFKNIEIEQILVDAENNSSKSRVATPHY